MNAAYRVFSNDTELKYFNQHSYCGIVSTYCQNIYITTHFNRLNSILEMFLGHEMFLNFKYIFHGTHSRNLTRRSFNH